MFVCAIDRTSCTWKEGKLELCYLIACIQLFTSTYNKTTEKAGDNYNAEKFQCCLYLEPYFDFVSSHYALIGHMQTVSRQKLGLHASAFYLETEILLHLIPRKFGGR